MVKKTTKKLGAPTKYKAEYCKQLIAHMAEGLSYESFAGLIGVHRDTLYEWEKVHSIFSDSKKIGKAKLLLFFEKLGRAGITGKINGFNASTYIFTMKNKCNWTDKQEIDATTNSTITIEQQDADL